MPDRSVGVYVHVPFCERVCPYCDFAVEAARPLGREREQRYVEALLHELLLRRGGFEGRTLESLYFGGGTPALLAPEQLARIAGAVRDAFPESAPRETTLEVNPSTIERERLPAFREAGVDRVSVGVQSFCDRTLKRLGRAHRAEEAQRTLDACRAAGFEELSLDLIFGAPDQGLADFEADLARAVAFAPEHVSTYELTIEPGTPFATAAGRGQLRRAPEDECVAMLEAAEARLNAARLARYELSNYARSGHEAVHNRRYWERRPVLGLGVGAFTTEPPGEGAPFGTRRSNLRRVDDYVSELARDRLPEAGSPEHLSASTARGEAMFLALRTAKGLSAEEFAAEFGGTPRDFFETEICELVVDGLLQEADAGDLRLSRRGRLLADSVSARFV